MRIIRAENTSLIKYQSEKLMKKILSPFCGLSQEIGYVSRIQSDKRLMIGSSALTGIHVLFNRPNPGRGAYHIGGTGILPNESMIRILGETIERYAQLISDFSFASRLKFASYKEMLQMSEPVLPFEACSFYSDNQLNRPGFPFNKISFDSKLSWIKMVSLNDPVATWVPAQFILVGYDIRRKDGEPWITSAVTTGTAAHVDYASAFRAALLELIQLDSVMGHWYSSWKAYEIEMDERTANLNKLINQYSIASRHTYRFYYIPNPDLAGFSIACVYIQDTALPRVVIGLGADLLLENAMYKAFLETVASVGLARMLIFKGKYQLDKHISPIDPDQLYDLDRNVEYYGCGKAFHFIEDRFLNMHKIKASDLPSDKGGNQQEQVNHLINTFVKNNKRIYWLDLTNVEAKSLGFRVARVWSPDTLSLCLPSAPQSMHSRFNDYGGIEHEHPHPYP
jgi:thiazole/oxazole-forming peptide maturase SagD family component